MPNSQKEELPQIEEPWKTSILPKKAKLNEKKLREKKKLKIMHLQEEIEFLKGKLETTDVAIMKNLKPSEKLKAEIKELEVKILTQQFQQTRLQDKYQMFLKAFKAGSATLKNSRTVAMDKEELELMAQKIENKKSELLTSRNFVKEMQHVGYKNLPPKIVDDCQRSHIELDYLRSCIQKSKEEIEDFVLELDTNQKELYEIQNQYNDNKRINAQMEKEVEEIINETRILAKLIQSKQREAEELNQTVEGLKKELDIVMDEQKIIQKLNEEEKAKYEKQREENRQRKIIRNRELEDLKNMQIQLETEYHNLELKWTQKSNLRDNLNKTIEISKGSKSGTKEVKKELEIILNEITLLNEQLIIETKLKMNYFNILEDMMGKLKIFCNCYGENNGKYFQIKDDRYLTVFSEGNDKSFQFDQCFESYPTNNKIFESLHHLYDMANDGFTCYIVIMGGTHSGKSFLAIGLKENGLMWLGLEKIQNIISENKKAEMTTRMFVCSVEMTDVKIYDLIAKKLNSKIEIKKDAFKMTVLSHANYKECYTVDEIRKYMKQATANRINAIKSLESSDTTFVFIITFQVFNKFKHRYKKGKLSYVKLARLNSMKSLNDELTNLTIGTEVDYDKTKITQLLSDCFGGIAKTCVVATINIMPKYIAETVETLYLASRLKVVVNEMEKNSDAEEIFRLKNDIERLLRGLQQEIL